MHLIIELLVLFLATTLFRIPFIATNDSDEWATFYRIKMQDGSKWPVYTLKDSVIPGYLGAPRLQYFILSLFPEKLWGYAGNALNILYDYFTASALYLLILAIRLEGADGLFGLFSPAFWVSILFTTSPVLFSLTPRLTGVKARTLGLFLIFMYFLILQFIFVDNIYFLIPVLIVIGILAISSSAFAMQNLVFLSLGLSLYLWNLIPALLMILIFGVGYLLPKWGVKQVLIHKMNHYIWYSKSRKGTTAQGKNSFRDLILWPTYLFTNKRKFFNILLIENSYLIMIYSVPVIWFALYLMDPMNLDFFQKHPVINFHVGLIVSGTGAFVLTSARPFLMLGEAERYFEFIVPYMSIIFVFLSISTASEELVPIAVLANVLIAQFFLVYRLKGVIKAGLNPLKKDADLDQCIAYLEEHDTIPRVLTIPVKYSYYLGYYTNKVKYYQIFVTSNGKIDGFSYMRNDLAMYDYPKDDIQHFVAKYDIGYVLVSKEYYRSKVFTYNFEKWPFRVVFENSKYLIFGKDKGRS